MARNHLPTTTRSTYVFWTLTALALLYALLAGLHTVQDFDLGLDFSTIPMRGRLAEGAYLAVQIPESFQTVWDWAEWVYLPAKGLVVKRDDHQELIPYNYLVFGISRYEGRSRP